ncbi:MAG: phosphopantetheine-binding protein [Salegentibacter sp.]|uniref:acyl carrier protein n=1 Tax=Salegentibacter sp. TaxID=1903072 RepID=UPI0028704CE0|nr:phosphopantetheine-binding protein [Salegentibacter sp.]MDR9458354.1 phosphopantetheine-binding protein [Salegentibacter sp.]
MTREKIQSAIFELLKKTAPDTNPTSLKPDENIREALNIDSFDALQFLVALNEKLGIDIPEEDYGKTATLGSLTDYLEERSQ